MPIVEGVDVEDVGVGGHEEEVLRERCEHMPWVKIKERSGKVQSKGSSKSDDDDSRARRAEESLQELIGTIFDVDTGCLAPRQESLYDKV